MRNKNKRVPLLFKIISPFTFLLITLVACQSENTAQKEEVNGFKIFTARCVNCHGADGRMGLNGAKILPLSALSVAQRVIVIAKGRNGTMPPFGGVLSKEEIEAVAEYTVTLK